MIKIEGKVNTAICYASVVEEGAIQQIKRMCDYEFTSGSKVRIMPDVHAGKGCTIGTTMTVTDRVVPNIVGVDIGCGMYTVNLGKGEIDFKRLDAASHAIPSGMKVWDREQETFDFESLKGYKQLKKVNWLKCSLGTLGGGNHFIEVEVSSDGTKYLVIHSGSRNLGKQVAELYQEMAINQHKGIGKYFESRESIIERLKAQGRESEIEDALAELKKKKENEVPDIPEDLCDLSGEPFEDYLHDIELCQQFARRNREIMASIILKRLGINGTDAFHTIHNYIDTKEMIIRKGAIAAHESEKVLIPINMRDGSILAVGKGNPEWNYSAPHGAGRVMSRMKAKQALSMKAYQETMKGIYTTSVTQATLDEAPMAYKSLEDIINVIGESVEIIEILKPIYNFKSSE